MKKLIGILIPTEWEEDYPAAVRELLDRFVIFRRIIPADQDGTVYQIEHLKAPEIGVGCTIPIYTPKLIKTDFMKILYI